MSHPPAHPVQDQVLDWVERVAAYFAEQHGMPPITGRILGWLMICEPPEQSVGQIVAAIGASRASLTTNMRLLLAAELVQRRTQPGERTAYYRVDDDTWKRLLQRRIASMTAFRAIARDGMDLVGAESLRATRIQAADAVYEWMAALLADAPAPPSPKRRG